jgi:hypothetical protein
MGRRSGLIGMVVQLARDLHLACEDNAELREALEAHQVGLSLSAARLLQPALLLPVRSGAVAPLSDELSLQPRTRCLQAWRDLLLPNGPLSKLLGQQQGSLAGGKPNSSGLQGMVEDEIPASQMHLRALFGVREYSQMHQSLSLGIPLQQ